MPRAGEDFFNRLSSFLRDTLYVSAASDKQRCGHIRPTHKNPSKPQTGLEGCTIFVRAWQSSPPKHRFFYLVGCAAKFIDEKRADELWGISQVHRLCVLASGTSAVVIFSCFAFINVCLWHLGQNSGKFFSSVSSRICTLVLLPQTGHSINFSFCIRYVSSNKW